MSTLKRGVKYLARTGDFKSAFDYLNFQKKLSSLLGVQRSQIQVWMDEFTSSEIPGYLEKELGSIEGNPAGALLNPVGQRTLHCCIRHLKPEIMIETGVSSGASTTVILAALKKNQKGRLISIDLPPYDYVKNAQIAGREHLDKDKQPGWIIPSHLRERWTLHMGRSKDLLPKVLKEQPTIDIFFHDSEHSYDNMMFEFKSAYESLRTGGIILADNAKLSPAFAEFGRSKGHYAIMADFGILIKK